MASTPQKDAIVFILDVNPSLWTVSNDNSSSKKEEKHFIGSNSYFLGVTLLDKGIHAITQMIHQKVLSIYFIIFLLYLICT